MSSMLKAYFDCYMFDTLTISEEKEQLEFKVSDNARYKEVCVAYSVQSDFYMILCTLSLA